MVNGPLPFPRLQFENGNGVPLSGGSVTTYLANGSTLATTYQDSTNSNPNTNPIVLDSNGSASIWGNGQYVLQVKDSLGNLLYTGPTQYTPFNPSVGSLLNVRYWTTPGTYTYTPTSGTLAVFVKVQGAGGASAGAMATGAGQYSTGGGGGSGGYGEALITSNFSGVVITVGAGGTSVSGANGNPGTGSSFGSLVATNGGGGGSASSVGSSGAGFGGSAAGIGSGPGYNCPGYIGMASYYSAGLLLLSYAFTVSPIGLLAGSGGTASAGNQPSSSAQIGVSGQPGIVVVYEYGNG